MATKHFGALHLRPSLPYTGKIDRNGRVAVWTSKNGKAKSFRIGGQLYVQFPVKPKAEQPAQGEGA